MPTRSRNGSTAIDHAAPLRELIDIDSQDMLPRADKIIEQARKTSQRRRRRWSSRCRRTREGIIAVGVAMVLLRARL